MARPYGRLAVVTVGVLKGVDIFLVGLSGGDRVVGEWEVFQKLVVHRRGGCV